MISGDDIEAMLEDDLKTADEIEQRVKLGVAKHREATRDEWFAVLRGYVFFRDRCAVILADMIGQGSDSMSLHEGPAKPSEM